MAEFPDDDSSSISNNHTPGIGFSTGDLSKLNEPPPCIICEMLKEDQTPRDVCGVVYGHCSTAILEISTLGK